MIIATNQTRLSLVLLVGAKITHKPSSAILEEGQNVTLDCGATGQPSPIITWSKTIGELPEKRHVIDKKGNLTVFKTRNSDSGTYVCKAENLLRSDSVHAQLMVVPLLKFTSVPPKNITWALGVKIHLLCSAIGVNVVTWQRVGEQLPAGHVIYSNGTLELQKVSHKDGGLYMCTAKSFHRSITAHVFLKVVNSNTSCSAIKTVTPSSPSGYYVIKPSEGVAPFSVFCDMIDKGGVGVTIISHDSESRTYVHGCGPAGCHRTTISYSGASMAQLASLTAVSAKCEQFIKYECLRDVGFFYDDKSWWVSRDGVRMNYWGGAAPGSKKCACGMSNTCIGGSSYGCNCDNHSLKGWREDSGLLTDKSTLPVSELRFGDVDESREKGYHTLGKLKCYGRA